MKMRMSMRIREVVLPGWFDLHVFIYTYLYRYSS
jgi:cytosine/adenosine deaminase-related metal-dependent hydrolase